MRVCVNVVWLVVVDVGSGWTGAGFGDKGCVGGAAAELEAVGILGGNGDTGTVAEAVPSV